MCLSWLLCNLSVSKPLDILTHAHKHSLPPPPDLQLLISQPKDICIHPTAFQQPSPFNSKSKIPQLLIHGVLRWRRLCPYLSSESCCFPVVLHQTALEALAKNSTIQKKPSSVSSLLCSYFLFKEISYCVYKHFYSVKLENINTFLWRL